MLPHRFLSALFSSPLFPPFHSFVFIPHPHYLIILPMSVLMLVPMKTGDGGDDEILNLALTVNDAYGIYSGRDKACMQYITLPAPADYTAANLTTRRPLDRCTAAHSHFLRTVARQHCNGRSTARLATAYGNTAGAIEFAMETVPHPGMT